MKVICTKPSANGVGAVRIEKILDEELVDNSVGKEDFIFMALIVNK